MRYERLLISAAIFIFSLGASATSPMSAHRDPGVSYKVYQNRLRQIVHPEGLYQTPMDVAAPYATAVLPAAQSWAGPEFLQKEFESVRDRRWMTTMSKPNFLRRSSWLYPDDGCFARASLAVMNAVRDGATAPNKVFAFGDLTVATPNSPYGEVTWWYHVAPIVEIDGQKYVIDPAINPKGAMTLQEWLSSMSADPGKIDVAVCASGTYTPDDSCAHVTDGTELHAFHDQNTFLYYEWNRLLDLHRDPEAELGDTPPWLDLTVF